MSTTNEDEQNSKSGSCEKIAELEKCLITGNIQNTYKDYNLSEDNKIRFLCYFDGEFFQRLATKKLFIIVHCLAIFVTFAKNSYINATITTLEKRFHIPTQNSGIIIAAYDLMAIASPFICHMLAKSHRPRWLCFFILMLACHCFLVIVLDSFYGPGEEALLLTKEYGGNFTSLLHSQTEHNTALCNVNENNTVISSDQTSEQFAENNYFPQIFLFINQIFGGIFNSVYESLASAYIDDNTVKTKVPFVFSVINFFRLMAPMFGYNLAAYCLSKYIAPNLTPIIDPNDNRWLGAWWYGYIIMGFSLLIIAIPLSAMPIELPRAAIRRKIAELTSKSNSNIMNKQEEYHDTNMRATFGRILRNKVFLYNSIAATGSFFGLLPFFIFSIKYVEVQYRESAADSSFYVGTVTQIFSVMGTLFAGWALYRYKPSARLLVLWNIFVGIAAMCATLSYTFLGCSNITNSIQTINANMTEGQCQLDCNCDQTKYTPICGDNEISYLTPCDAGCLDQIHYENGTIQYANCSCITNGGSAVSGLCPVNCKTELYIVISLMCISTFLQSSAKMSIFLICMRCVAPSDKTVALALFGAIFSYCALIPSPILFGWIIDQTCTFWEQTADGSGNCWAYNESIFRYWFNIVAAAFLGAGVVFGDYNVYRNVKNLTIFDEPDDDNVTECSVSIDNEMEIMNGKCNEV